MRWNFYERFSGLEDKPKHYHYRTKQESCSQNSDTADHCENMWHTSLNKGQMQPVTPPPFFYQGEEKIMKSVMIQLCYINEFAVW